MHEDMKRALAQLAALMKVPAAQRDEKAITDAIVTLGELTGKLPHNEDNAKAFEGMKAAVDQLQADHDKAVTELRELQKSKLIGRGVTVLPNGQKLFQFSHPELARGFADFCQKVATHDKALGPVSDAEGGYAIPDTWVSEIEIMIWAVGVLRQIAGPFPLGPGTTHKARRLSGATMHWKAPGAQAMATTPNFGQLEMAPETLMAYTDVDVEFEEDSFVNIGNYLASEFAYGMATEEDRVAFSGTGVVTDGGITGLLNSTYVTTVTADNTKTAFSQLTYDNIVDLEASVWDGALGNSQYVLHRTILAAVKKIRGIDNLPIWQPPASGEPGEIIGYPYRRANQMPATAASAPSSPYLAFGDFRKGVLFGTRGQMRIDYSTAPGWLNLQTCWRAYERIDIAVQGFTAAEIAAHAELANPIAILKTAAQ